MMSDPADRGRGLKDQNKTVEKKNCGPVLQENKDFSEF
jgi:hypothetical protein